MLNEKRVTLISECLTTAFKPSHLEVIDESYKHKGHEGAKSGLGHFKVRIASAQFHHTSAIQTHRMIYAALGDLMTTDIHALTIEIM